MCVRHVLELPLKIQKEVSIFYVFGSCFETFAVILVSDFLQKSIIKCVYVQSMNTETQ